MLYIIVFICFIIIFMFFYGTMLILNKSKLTIGSRIKQVKNIDTDIDDRSEIAKRSFSQRALMPFYKMIIQFIIKATPNKKITLLKKKLEKAGLLKNNTPENWLYIRIMIMLIFSILSGFLSYKVEANFFKALLIALLIMLLISTVFNFYLSKKISIRKKTIVRELPYTLDLITVSVEAGLSFDGAMARVIANISGELCDEFAKTLKEIRMGIQRKVALKNMNQRCEVKELSLLLTSLIQADDLGVGLSHVLRLESEGLREHRKQVAREAAMKAPIKMLFPLIFFIFPSIFIIILGPTFIRVLKMF
ncbi:type II secretion system F family protein [Clostridium sp.]|uniref:type II secretion system F family protein n=1 Tax=Clostridium sp. TaxID=1506 RepID=UPI001A412D22|nr:type II secretion system F family protein [Clostridium sp.]MBK5234341.1 type II secretion system F family protein [Clostridium sp.]